jgi:surface protein
MVWFFVAAMLLMVDVVGAVFAPADNAALKAAVGRCSYEWTVDAHVCTGGCLGETANGSCPIFAASNDATGNPYGVIGLWNVSQVTSMDNVFLETPSFNANISNWDVSSATTMFQSGSLSLSSLFCCLFFK